MRRFTLSLIAGLLLATTAAQPAAASGIKEYMDCIAFTNRWCDLAREEVNNFIEGWAVETSCALRLLACGFQIL